VAWDANVRFIPAEYHTFCNLRVMPVGNIIMARVADTVNVW
jgi:hypothetical protein